MKISGTEELINEFRAGRMVVLIDDEDEENEGDLLMPAVKVRPEDINFMAKYGRGLICLTLTSERCERLRLPQMVSQNNSAKAMDFTVSIEAAHGVTTGISAVDRAKTIRMAVAPNAVPQDLVQPGHVFPLMESSGGVLTRAGHVEAGCDLAQLAGLEPAAVVVGILNQDGTMARGKDLEKFGREHDIKIGTIADLIAYRLRTEKTVRRVSACPMPMAFGDFMLYGYQDFVEEEVHFALAKGKISAETPVLVRVHVYDSLCDLLGSRRGDCGWGWPLRDALRRLSEEESGAVVILRQHESPAQLLARIQDYGPREEPEPSNDLRSYGIGAQILKDLGVRRMRILGSPKRVHALSGFDLEITEYVRSP